MNTTPEAPSMTATELLENLRQRIADGDTSITAAELQQAESGVEFAKLQAAGQAKREAAAEHQARLDELEKIREEVENGLPNISGKIHGKLEKIDKDLADLLQLANEHDRKVLDYGKRIRDLADQGATVGDIEATADGVIAGDVAVRTINLETCIARATRQKADQPLTELSFAEKFKPVVREHIDASVSVRLLKNLGGHEEGAVIKVMPSIAERMIDAGNAEAA